MVQALHAIAGESGSWPAISQRVVLRRGSRQWSSPRPQRRSGEEAHSEGLPEAPRWRLRASPPQAGEEGQLMSWLRSAWNWPRRVWNNYVAPAWSWAPGAPKRAQAARVLLLADERRTETRLPHCLPALLRAALLVALAGPASAVTIDWVPVGDPDNPPDAASNCNAVDCGSGANAYRISKYEVTNAQYAEFLNAVDASGSNTLALYNASMSTDATFGGIRFDAGNAAGEKSSVKAGFASKPVNYVSLYDALRFSNWLKNGQGSPRTETG